MPAASRHRVRSVLATVCGVLAVLLLVVTLIAVWARATVFRGDHVAELVGDALAEPEVQTGLATYLSEQAVTAVDLEGALANVLPAPLTGLAPAIAGGARAIVERELERALSNPDVQQVITTVVERAHARAMRVLQGDGLADGITVSDGEVTVNLLPLIARGLAPLQSWGLLSDVQLPTLTPDGDPAEQNAALSTALGRDLPAGFGQLVVYRGAAVSQAQESVQSAQQMLAAAKRALWLIAVLVVVLTAAAILLAPRRWRAVLVLSVGTAAALVVLRAATRQAVEEAPDLASRPGGKAAVEAILGGAAQSLLRVFGVVLLVALVVTLLALFALRWRRQDLVLVGAVALGAAVVALAGVSIWSLLIGLVVGVAAGIVANRLLGRREPPSAEIPAPEAPAAVATVG